MKRVLKNRIRALSGRFLLSKGDDIKIKRRVGPFSLPPPVYLAFIVVLSLFFAPLHGLEAAYQGEIAFSSTIFINPDISKLYMYICNEFEILIFAGPREARNPNLNIDQRIVYCACAPGL